MDIADEFLISDGYSEDGTYDYLEYAAKKFENIKLFQDRWVSSQYGECIAIMTNLLKNRAKCHWVYNIQADEIIHETLLPKLRYITRHHKNQYRGFALKFLHFVGDFNHVETKPGYDIAVRLVPNTENIFATDDGWTFRGEIDPVGVIESPPLFHFGWIYAKDNLYKRKNQAKFVYREQKSYQKDYELCDGIERQIDEDTQSFVGWQRKMLAARKIRKYTGSYPRIMVHLMEKGNVSYQPDVKVLDMAIPFQSDTANGSYQDHLFGASQVY